MKRVFLFVCLLTLPLRADPASLWSVWSPRDEAALRREAERRHLRLTRIGRVTAGQGVVARFGGQPVTFARAGFTHG